MEGVYKLSQTWGAASKF